MRKQIILVLILGVLPLLLLSYVHDYQTLCKTFHIKNVQSFSRNWIIQEVLGESYSNEIWLNDSKTVYVYNAAQPTRIDTVKSFMYNEDSMEWIPMMNVGYTYDNSGQYVTQLEYTISIMGMTFPMFRMTAQYDNQHRTTLWTTSSYDMENMEWVLNFWSKIFYNTNSVNSIVSYNAESEDEPESWEKTIFVNDGQGRPTSTTNQTSADSLIWVESDRTQFTYHAHDNSTGADFIDAIAHMYIMMEGSPAVSNWGTAMVAETIEQVYSEGWQNDTKTTLTYDAQDKLIESIYMNWSGDWINETKNVMTYDASGNLYQNTESSWSDPDWLNGYRYTFTWNQGTAVEDNHNPAIDALSISSYPNPFAGDLSIDIRSKTGKPVSVSIYNTRGQLVKTMLTRSNSSVVWNGNDESNNPAAKGIYFIKVQADGVSTIGKILKLK